MVKELDIKEYKLACQKVIINQKDIRKILKCNYFESKFIVDECKKYDPEYYNGPALNIMSATSIRIRDFTRYLKEKNLFPLLKKSG